MICYRDMTFCTYYEDCENAKDCHRPLTPEVYEAAVRWWGGVDAPISQFSDKPGCWVKKEGVSDE